MRIRKNRSIFNKSRLTCLASLLSVILFTTVIFADNPIIQTLYTADPAPMVYNGRVYLYTSHDDDKIVDNFYTMRNWRCYSSADMVNWVDHGMAASCADLKWIGNTNNGAWAPQCVERGGKFYLYVPIQGKGIGVLVSDSPTGPFKDPIGKGLINRGNWSDIDPTAFVDSDGQAYLYWGNGTLWYVKLNENMTSYSGNVITASKPASYVEGPWFYKRNNLYYMIYAGMDGGSENIQYATSSSPTGPWTSKGVFMPKQGSSFTNHPGVCDFKGNSYLFYHNAALPGGGSYHRSVCVEQFTYKADGSFPSISMSTTGAKQLGTLNPYDTVQAETICQESGVETEVCSEGGINVDSISNNDYIRVKGVNFGDGAVSFMARVSSATSGGNIELHLDSQTGTLIGTCAISNTGGWQTWVTKSCTITGAKDTHDLYLKFTGGSGVLFKLNWWKFNQDPTNVSLKSPLNRPTVNNFIVTGKAGKTITLTFSLPENFSEKRCCISLSDLSGRTVNTAYLGNSTDNGRGSVQFTGIQSGMYLVRLLTKSNLINAGSGYIVVK